jgi:dihydroorotate dehydrogenase electron transfer subunit
MATSLPQVARIVAVADESAKVRTFVLDLHLAAEPGQFVMAWLPGVDEKPFSLVEASPVTLSVARVGLFTTTVLTLEVGDLLWLRGPLGRPFVLPSAVSAGAPQGAAPDARGSAPGQAPPLMLIAGGYGVAPLFFLAGRARAAGRSRCVVIGARTAGDVVFAERFAALGAEVVVATDDGSAGQKGLATEAADMLLGRRSYEGLYACGPEPMLEAVEALSRKYHLPAQLSYERYMRCAFGVCGSCTRSGWLVCRDGPVRVMSPWKDE